MIYGSICSGIEAATEAWHPLGWKPEFFSEIEPSCRDVLAHRWPGVPIHGDFTTIKRNEYGTIDVLVGGTPCQDFSIAGLRKGFAGNRGNLTLEFLRLVDRLRPTWVVWENVPGVLSIDGGRAFGSFLGGLAKLGYGFGYRVLDAQFYGVAQRRRRVVVVGYLGNWRPPAAVLFDSESMSGNPAPSRKARQETSCDVRNGVARTIGSHKTGGFGGSDLDTNGALIPETAHTLRGEGFDASEDGSGRGTPLTSFRMQAFGEYSDDGGASSLKARDYKDATDLVVFDSKGSQAHVERGDVSPALRAMTGKKMNGGGQVAVAIQQNQLGEIRTGDVAGTLNTNSNASGRNTPMAIVSYDLHQITSKTNGSNPKAGDPLHTLHSRARDTAISIDIRNALRDPEKHDAQNRQGLGIGGDTAGTITSAHQGGVSTASATRRLTPRECERLQGFPDDYTLTPITLKNRQTRTRWQSDSARYRMIGNSMAVPMMRRLGERIELVHKLMEEMSCSNRTSSASRKKNIRLRRASPKSAKHPEKRRQR